MLIKKKPDLTYSDVTPKALYMGRRNFLLGLLATSARWRLTRTFRGLWLQPGRRFGTRETERLVQGPYSKDNTSEKVTPEQDVTHYNNYYEFGTDKADPVQKRRRIS